MKAYINRDRWVETTSFILFIDLETFLGFPGSLQSQSDSVLCSSTIEFFWLYVAEDHASIGYLSLYLYTYVCLTFLGQEEHRRSRQKKSSLHFQIMMDLTSSSTCRFVGAFRFI